ncbi:MAG: hypothetical protein V1690_00785 [Candidatus Moraniibacteriota bacterium]
MNLINTAHAATNSLVSCSGNDCSLCSLLQTVSNGYNFFLGVCVAVAVLVLIIAGVSYLISSGDKFRLQKSSYFLKSGIGGFALILVGWLIIQTAIRTAGFPNAGSWWNFECNDGTENSALSSGEEESGFSPYYNNLKTFPDLLTYFGSNEKTAKITGPIDAKSFASQLKALKDGEVLHFLAPARVDSGSGTQDLFLPLLTVLKEGDNLSLQSTGEYWNLIQNEWPQLKDQISDPSVSDLLSQYLGNNSYTDSRSLIDGSGNILSAEGNSGFSSLFNSLAQMLKYNSASGDRTNSDLNDEIAGNASLSELLAILASPDSNSQEQKDKIMSIFTTETLKLSDILMVDKESSSEIFSTAQSRCASSGGVWDSEGNNLCQCPDGSQLQADGNCQSTQILETNCGKSGGSWQKVSDGFEPPAVCGDSTGLLGGLDLDSARANISEVASENYYCKCKSANCIDGKGTCRSDLKDDDGDKIANNADRCPSTPAVDKSQINKTKGSQYYGCSCFEIGAAPKECPPDQCVGDNWVNYPSEEKQQCKNGELLPFSCQPTERSFDETCSQKNLADSGTQEWNGNTNSSDSKTQNWAQSPYNNSSANQAKSASAGSKGSNLANKGTPKSNSGNKKINDDRLGNPKDPGESGIASTNDHGSPLGVKESLKRIYQRDKLRYLMIFKYVSYIEPSGGGGVTWSNRVGVIGVNFGAPVKLLDQLIIHEATHRADFSWDGWNGTDRDMESVAVANQVGSVGRIKESLGQKEEIKVALTEGKDQEVRGYESRWLDRDVDPRGDMDPSDIGFYCGYAKEKGGGTKGSNIVYGWPPGGEKYILRLNDFQENRMRIIMDKINQRFCMSKPSDDMPQLNEESGYTEEQLKGCKKEDTKTPIIKIGG